jgi:hypothetical protein
MKWFEILSQVATDVTACVAVVGYGSYRLTLYRRVRALEKALSKKTQLNDNSLTVQQLAIELTLTEDQVIDAAARSRVIEPWAGQSGTEYRFRLKPKSN